MPTPSAALSSEPSSQRRPASRASAGSARRDALGEPGRERQDPGPVGGRRGAETTPASGMPPASLRHAASFAEVRPHSTALDRPAGLPAPGGAAREARRPPAPPFCFADGSRNQYLPKAIPDGGYSLLSMSIRRTALSLKLPCGPPSRPPDPRNAWPSPAHKRIAQLRGAGHAPRGPARSGPRAAQVTGSARHRAPDQPHGICTSAQSGQPLGCFQKPCLNRRI
jgi:hypothetical protein